MKKSEWFLVGMAVVMFVTGILFYPHLPAEVASHWNTAGQVNGSMSRFWGVFIMPILFALVLGVFIMIPRIDPKKENIAHFRNYYNWFVGGLAVVFYYIYLLFLLWNLGYVFNMTVALVPAFALLFYWAGIFLPHTQPNWMIGIRTPWTISSPTVWKKTHEAGGPLFKLCGLIALLGIVLPGQAIWFMVAPILASAIGLTVYSYILYSQENH